MNRPIILHIDDEIQMRKLLAMCLEDQPYQLISCATAKEGMISAASHPPDLILLDIGLPDRNGQEVLKELRRWYLRPIIILSVQDAENDIVNALDAGADDYLTKPFRPAELLARIRNAIRRSSGAADNQIIQSDQIQIDLLARTVSRQGDYVHLTATEFNLLALLAKNQGRVLTHQFLLREIWGISYSEETQYLRVFIGNIRKKIEAEPNRPNVIITESGIGYRMR